MPGQDPASSHTLKSATRHRTNSRLSSRRFCAWHVETGHTDQRWTTHKNKIPRVAISAAIRTRCFRRCSTRRRLPASPAARLVIGWDRRACPESGPRNLLDSQGLLPCRRHRCTTQALSLSMVAKSSVRDMYIGVLPARKRSVRTQSPLLQSQPSRVFESTIQMFSTPNFM